MQSLPSFTQEFGVLNPTTGAYTLSTGNTSLITSIVSTLVLQASTTRTKSDSLAPSALRLTSVKAWVL